MTVFRYATGTTMTPWDRLRLAVANFKNRCGSVAASVLILLNSDKFIIWGDDQRWHCPRVTAAGVDGLGVVLLPGHQPGEPTVTPILPLNLSRRSSTNRASYVAFCVMDSTCGPLRTMRLRPSAVNHPAQTHNRGRGQSESHPPAAR